MLLRPRCRGPKLAAMLASAPSFSDTLAALRSPRRAIPIALLAAALCAGQLAFTPDPGALALALLLVVAFALVAPHAWRRLFGAGRIAAAAPLRATLFIGLALALTAGLAWALPVALGYRDAFLSAPGSLLLEPALFCVGGWGLGRDIELERDPLALLVRDLLEADRAPTWALARELEIVKSLCDLHRLRRPDTGSVRVTVAPAAGAAGVQSLVLLPLAGVLAYGGEATLDARADGDALVLTLEQVGRARPDAEGLTRVRERIASVYADRASVEVSVERDGRARLIVRLPVTADVTPSASTA